MGQGGGALFLIQAQTNDMVIAHRVRRGQNQTLPGAGQRSLAVVRLEIKRGELIIGRDIQRITRDDPLDDLDGRVGTAGFEIAASQLLPRPGQGGFEFHHFLIVGQSLLHLAGQYV